MMSRISPSCFLNRSVKTAVAFALGARLLKIPDQSVGLSDAP
jgi:hypothetical protein